MRRIPGGFLLPMVCVMLYFFLPISCAQSEDIFITEALINPDGTDTGKEYVEIQNTSGTLVDISGWDLDPGALPYFTFPNGTTLPSGGTLVVYLRQQGTNTVTEMFTGTSFGSSDMVNTKGSVVLFRSTTHASDQMVDFLEYGESTQTHESLALPKLLWEAGTFFALSTEGKSIQRICLEHKVSCFQENAPNMGIGLVVPTMINTNPTPTTGSGTGLPATQGTSGVLTPSGVLLNSSPVVSTASGATISTPALTASGSAMLGDTKVENLPPVPNIKLQGKGVLTGTVPFSLNLTGEDSTDDKGISNYLWDYGDGYAFQGKNPLEHEFVNPGSYPVKLTVIDTEGAYASEVIIIIVTEKSPVSSSTITSTSTQTSSTQQSTTSQSSSSYCTPSTGVSLRFSEILPNPTGKDKGREWIELYNNSDVPLCLEGLKIEEGTKKLQTYLFGALLMGAREYLVVPDSLTKIAMDNKDGKLRILLPDGTELDRVTYADAPSGKSWSRVGK